MVKIINLAFDDLKYDRLAQAKERSKLNWHDFIMLLVVRKLPKRKN